MLFCCCVYLLHHLMKNCQVEKKRVFSINIKKIQFRCDKNSKELTNFNKNKHLQYLLQQIVKIVPIVHKCQKNWVSQLVNVSNNCSIVFSKLRLIHFSHISDASGLFPRNTKLIIVPSFFPSILLFLLLIVIYCYSLLFQVEISKIQVFF